MRLERSWFAPGRLTVLVCLALLLCGAGAGLEVLLPGGRAPTEIWTAAVSPNGKLLAYGGKGRDIRLWDTAAGRPLGNLQGHRSSIDEVAFSPDGKLLVSGSDDDALKIWDLATRKVRATMRHEDDVNSVAFSPDGRTVLSGSSDGTVRLWEADTGILVAKLPEVGGQVVSVAFSPDGKLAAAGSFSSKDFSGYIQIWDTSGHQLMKMIKLDSSNIGGIAFSPDGTTLAAGLNGHVALWRVSTWGEAGALTDDVPGAHYTNRLDIAYSRDGRYLVDTSKTRTPRLWDVASGKLIGFLKGHTHNVVAVAFSPNGKRLYTAGQDGTIRLWATEAGRPEATLVALDDGQWVVYAPDGRFDTTFPAGELGWRQGSSVTDPEEAARKNRVPGLWSQVAGGKVRAAANPPAEERPSLPRQRGHQFNIYQLAFSPDGKLLATASQDQTVILWEPASGRQLAVLKEHESGVTCLAFSPDGRKLATGDLNGNLRTWDVASGKPLASLGKHATKIFSIAWSPDGRRLASAGNDRTVRLWELASGRLLTSVPVHQDNVYTVVTAFTVDGKQLITGVSSSWGMGQGGSEVKFWNIASGRQVRMLSDPPNILTSMAVSADGKRIAAGKFGGMFALWDVPAGRIVANLKGGSQGTFSLAFSRDGRHLAAGNHDSTVTLWDLAAGKVIATLRGHSGPVDAVGFSPDGRWLVSGGSDALVNLWNAKTGKHVATISSP